MGSNKYTLPKLNGHKVVYKGRRFWIFEIDEKHPFQGYEGIQDRLIVYDKVYGSPVASVGKTSRGFEGALIGTMDRVEVGGASTQDLLVNTVNTMRFYEKSFAGFISPETARPYRIRKTK